MWSSLPFIAPRDAHTLWYTPSHSYGFTTPPASTAQYLTPAVASQTQLQSQRQAVQSRENRRIPSSFGPSALTQLDLDEKSVQARKHQIQRFGSTWIKPPGLVKTLQGELDERLEKEEHMAMEDVTGEGFTFERTGNEDVTDADNLPEGVELTMDGEEGDDVEGEEGEMFEEGLEEEPDLDAEIPEGSGGVWSDSEVDEHEVDLDDDIPEPEEDEEEEEEEEEDSHIISEASETFGVEEEEDSDEGQDIGGLMTPDTALPRPGGVRFTPQRRQLGRQHSPLPMTPQRRVQFSPRRRPMETSFVTNTTDDDMEVDSE